MKTLILFFSFILAFSSYSKSQIIPISSESKDAFRQRLAPQRQKVERPSRFKEREVRKELRTTRVQTRKVIQEKRRENNKVSGPREQRRLSFVKRKLMQDKNFTGRMQGLKRRERHKTPQGGQRFQAQRIEKKRLRQGLPPLNN